MKAINIKEPETPDPRRTVGSLNRDDLKKRITLSSEKGDAVTGRLDVIIHGHVYTLLKLNVMGKEWSDSYYGSYRIDNIVLPNALTVGSSSRRATESKKCLHWSMVESIKILCQDWGTLMKIRSVRRNAKRFWIGAGSAKQRMLKWKTLPPSG